MIRLSFCVYLDVGEPIEFLEYLNELAEDAEYPLKGIRIIVGQTTAEFSAAPEVITDEFVDLVGLAAKMFGGRISEIKENEGDD
jgi:hypothetical protein